MSDFKDSAEAAFRRMVRESVRGASDLTRAERDATLVLLNLWFHHRSGARGHIMPTKEMVAKKAKVSPRSVCTLFTKLRASGVLVASSKTTGGRSRPTRYRLNISNLLTLCGCEFPEWIAGISLSEAGAKPRKNRAIEGGVNHANFARAYRYQKDVPDGEEPLPSEIPVFGGEQ